MPCCEFCSLGFYICLCVCVRVCVRVCVCVYPFCTAATNSICTPRPHLSITIKSHSLHLVSPSRLQKFNLFILFLSLFLLHVVTCSHTFTIESFLTPLDKFFFFLLFNNFLNQEREHTCTHSLSGYLSPSC